MDIEIFVNRPPPIISEILSKATSTCETGDFNKAIEYLKQAYQEIAKTGFDQGIETFLRLPLYLQKAGRSDEAWVEFNNLLTKGYPNQSINEVDITMTHSRIYDKMRLFLQRENRYIEAIKYGIFSYLLVLTFWYKQTEYCKRSKDKSDRFLAKRFRQELALESTEKSITEMLLPLLKKAKRESLLNDLIEFLKLQIEKLPNVNLIELSEELNKILQIN
jgi:tetratricopeptide (TPR) repeat protein